ncbi:hypothetical protein LJR290_002707 [Variovorax sp. LjRoot290]|uniref:hypothetical protein n=1 Tax=unclassified Variovorax TaxID=663243 RepID=UPI003ECC9C62
MKYVVFEHEMMFPHLCGVLRGFNVATLKASGKTPSSFMVSLSSFFRFLSFPSLGLRRSADRQMGQIRTAMLSLLQVHGGHSVQRVAQRVRFAGDLEALWYLRQDVLTALSAIDGEVAARRQMRQINRLFKGGLPGAMGPRPHHRITT